MRGNYIDFISAYCDRWCERCRFTDRCSAYAVHVATAMCGGDFHAGIELAVGAPPPMTARERQRREEFLKSLADIPEPTATELAEWEPDEDAREERIDELSVTTASEVAWTLAYRWLDAHAEVLKKSAAGEVAAAVEVTLWDCSFIHVKLHRALSGREWMADDGLDDDPVQNDWNGSAKVALISILRSIDAWEVIAAAAGDDEARQIANALRALKRETEAEFPRALEFIRPGFEEPSRP